MTVVYMKHPAGYPQTARRVVQAGDQWAVEVDRWDAPTSHGGWRRGEVRYQSREEAVEAMAIAVIMDRAGDLAD